MSSVLGIYFAFTSDRIRYAFLCLIFAGVCDLFDGAVARRCKRTEEEKQFGIELDSLVDVVSFIALPVCIFVSMGLTHIWDIVIFMLFAIAGVARLTYFNINTADSEGPIDYYTGLPVTVTAFFFPLIYLVRLVLDDKFFIPFFTAWIVIVTVLQVLRIKFKKPRGVWYGIFAAMAVAMIVAFIVLV